MTILEKIPKTSNNTVVLATTTETSIDLECIDEKSLVKTEIAQE